MLYAYGFNNITSKAFSDYYSQNGNRFQCRDYFNKFPNSMADQICNSNSLTLDNYQGIVTWTIAMYLYFDPDYLQKEDPTKQDWRLFKEWDAGKFIMEELKIESKDEFELYYKQSMIQSAMNQI
jgi:hypothetical protein